MLSWRGILRLTLLGLAIGGALCDCPVSDPGSTGHYVVCSKSDSTKTGCENTDILGSKCCWSPNADKNGGKCWWDSRGARRNNRRAQGGGIGSWTKGKVPPQPNNDEVIKLARSVKVDDNPALGKVSENTKSGTRRNLRNPFTNLILGSVYPECPVHVKLCYRVPCGGYNNQFQDTNPIQCLSDPRCCYDYKLGFLKSLFGPRYMNGAPACYYGATSKQWEYVTGFFKPWNPWMTTYILRVFKGLFNTNAFNIGGKLACEIDFQRKAYPVGSKSELQCNLVSGCWDSSLPAGSRCTMASELIQQLFGSTQVYPSLFTNDPSEQTCSANWLDIGPKAYNRLPCGIGSPPPSLFEKLFTWCPSTDCCLNYASLSSSELGELALLTTFQGGGLFSQFSQGFTQFNPQTFGYLISASSLSGDLTKLFCPYRIIFKASILPDLTDDVEGCCDIPDCYHKKKLTGYVPPPPPTRSPPVVANWGQWGPCNAPCNQIGTRTRQCFVGNRPQPGFCPGQGSQSCQGPPCPVQASWGQWQRASDCSVTCGSGVRTLQRSCLVRGQPVNPASCPGGAQAATRTQGCNQGACQPSYQWGPLVMLQPCSVTCGSGVEVYGRRCQSPTTGQVVPDNFCPGTAQRQNRACRRAPCRQQASWTQWRAISPCGATCGDKGVQVQARRCLYSDGSPAQNVLCGGPAEQIIPCPRQPCPRTYYWAGCTADPCQIGPGGRYCTIQRQRNRRMICYDRVGGGFQKVAPQSLCGPQPAPCSPIPCRVQDCLP